MKLFYYHHKNPQWVLSRTLAAVFVILEGLVSVHFGYGQTTDFDYHSLTKEQKAYVERYMGSCADWDELQQLRFLQAYTHSASIEQRINDLYKKYVVDISIPMPGRLKMEFEENIRRNNDQIMSRVAPKGIEDETLTAEQEAMYARSGMKGNALQQERQMESLRQAQIDKQLVQEVKAANYNSKVTAEINYYDSPEFLNDLPNYHKAQNLLKQMVTGEIPVSIKDAYFYSEAAYGGLHLRYEEYNSVIEENARFIRQWLKENGYDPNDPEALHFGIQRFMSDTLTIERGFQADGQRGRVQMAHTPYYYDYIDATAREDVHNYFVTKTLATGTGQCHTLPVTYLILAEALGVEAYMAYNPQHSFIRYRNNKGTWINYECTTGSFMPDPFYLETLPVMAKAGHNKIYLDTLSKKQVVASVLTDLAHNFEREHWLADGKFIRECMNTTHTCFAGKEYINSAYAYLENRLLAEDFNALVQQKGIESVAEIEQYPDVLNSYQKLRNHLDKISRIGVQDFPEEDYIQLMLFYDKQKRLQTARNIDAKSRKDLFYSP